MSAAEHKDPEERLSKLTATFRDLEAYVQQDKIRTIHYGIGAIGAEVVRSVLNSPEFEIVGAIDASASKAGKDLGEAAGIGHALGIPVSYEPEPLLRDVYADVVVHCTGSSLTEVYPQIMTMLASEKSVVSSCEELAFPWIRYPEVSAKLDRKARETGVRVLGTGVNPGFVMDYLPLTLATASQHIKAVRVERVVDVATRRIQLQRKAGVGLSVSGFQQASRRRGRRRSRESSHMIADTGLVRLRTLLRRRTHHGTRAEKDGVFPWNGVMVSARRHEGTGLRSHTSRSRDNSRRARPRDAIEIVGTPLMASNDFSAAWEIWSRS
jgi:hypothetical protein